ncbi:hypothetical protein ACP8HI_14895 [Paenibacillus sp. FA6]|uniref:hypothetical protein n=1 Tax=Paenibacillus sp. FA6 TaxID=3413029 RepID=UPI003F65F67A
MPTMILIIANERRMVMQHQEIVQHFFPLSRFLPSAGFSASVGIAHTWLNRMTPGIRFSSSFPFFGLSRFCLTKRLIGSVD